MVAATLAIKCEFRAEWSQGAGDKGAKRPSQEYHPMKSADISLTTLNCTRIWGNTDSVSKDKGQNEYWVDNLGVSASPNHVTNLAFVLIFSLFMYQNHCPHLLAIGRQHVSQWRVCTWVRLSVFWSQLCPLLILASTCLWLHFLFCSNGGNKSTYCIVC